MFSLQLKCASIVFKRNPRQAAARRLLPSNKEPQLVPTVHVNEQRAANVYLYRGPFWSLRPTMSRSNRTGTRWRRGAKVAAAAAAQQWANNEFLANISLEETLTYFFLEMTFK